MTDQPTLVEPAAPPASGAAAPTWADASYAVTVLISSFLLFQVQPLIGKFILPWFGGSPAVWMTAMVFFQVVLFGGYAYAHVSEKVLRPTAQAFVHFGLLAAAILLLPIVPNEALKPTDSEQPAWRILALLTGAVGLPYFVLSSTGPLSQAWFGRRFPGRSPYRLFALSNFGSLVALLSYPLVFEPAWDVVRQAWMWSGAFLVFAASCAFIAYRNWRLRLSGAELSSVADGLEKMAAGPKPTAGRRALWVALPAFASMMLLAATNHVCQDVAVIPFLWVVPLSLYLLSFIICFDHPRWYLRTPMTAAMVLAVLAIAGRSYVSEFLLDTFDHSMSFAEILTLYFAGLFLICMVCHGELVSLRPAPAYLTEYYLLISAGGALGGIFVSLVAPRIFSTYLEWDLGLVGATLVGTAVLLSSIKTRKSILPSLLATGAVAAAVVVSGLMARKHDGDPPIDRVRNFYGVVSVWDDDAENPAQHNHCMRHGRIVHGRQFLAPEKEAFPLTYYSEKTGVGRAVLHTQKRGPTRIGVVGLGVGTLATYARPGDEVKFYEINPEVERIALKHFTFLSKCRGKCEVALGDARLTLEQEPPQKFDVLALDAFSGDGIPTHLLTEEAVEMYRRHLTPNGILAVHITNRHIDLRPVVKALVERFGFKVTWIYMDEDERQRFYESNWALLTLDDSLIEANPPILNPADDVAGPPLMWTDHYSNLLQILR